MAQIVRSKRFWQWTVGALAAVFCLLLVIVLSTRSTKTPDLATGHCTIVSGHVEESSGKVALQIACDDLPKRP